MTSTTINLQQACVPPEIMDIIFEELAPKNSKHEPDVKKALLSCLSASRYCRQFALHRLFRSIRISAGKRCLPNIELLLEIVWPLSPQVRWMSRSILPCIREVDICLHDGSATECLDLVEPCLLQFLRILLGDQTHCLTTLTLRLRDYALVSCTRFSEEFQAVVASLIKLPHLQSVTITGANFLSPDFLRGTHISQLDISYYNPHRYFCNPDGTLSLSPSSEEEIRGDSPLRSLTTDTSFPFRLETPLAKSLLERLDKLDIHLIDDRDDGYDKVPEILRFTTSLTTLVLRYNELYGEFVPLRDWQTDFGELQALETLKMSIGIAYIDHPPNMEPDFIVLVGTYALALLLSALNSIRRPMPRLGHVEWLYSFFVTSSTRIPFPVIESWLLTFDTWRTLDRTLGSDLFPVLSRVQLRVHTRTDDENQLPDVGATRTQRAKKEVFPQLFAALGENFKLDVKCGT